MASPNEQNTYPKLTPADLQDPTLFRLQTMLDFLYSQIDQTQVTVTTVQRQLASGVPSTTPPSTVTSGQIIEILLEDPGPTTITYSGLLPQAGDVLTVFIRQDATGGRQIAWDAIFANTSVNINMEPNSEAVFTYTGRYDGLWWLTSLLLQ